MWIVAAVLSAVFAGMTAVLSKCGVKTANANVATAVRMSVVLLFAWIIVFATGASWLCYYYAIRQGHVSVVVPVDKLSLLITVFFSLVVFKERLSPKAWAGLALLTAGTVCMAVCA
ncbi:MAG: EamA family transporter [Treponemataceae bacterium]|nr:EamA family transporter [Treponemataceae bacterium]